MKKIYFVGAGGIGMANLVRYYLRHGVRVAGYDRSESELTRHLQQEGAELSFVDSVDTIPADFKGADSDGELPLVVYTPAVPESNSILSYFRALGCDVVKRAVLLGKITHNTDAICVAGSHGKTTTSSMIANIMRGTEAGCTAFLGGILRNIDSNLVLNEKSRYTVIEADEYDRSFHQLRPQTAIITSTDPDHLDIYGDEEHYLEAFSHFTGLIRQPGLLLLHTGLKMREATQPGVAVETYSGTDRSADWHAEDIAIGNGEIRFTLAGPGGMRIERLSPGVPVEINIDNAVAAAAAALHAGATPEEVRRGLETFKGAKRRFEVYLDGTQKPGGNGTVLIDDYAHSPNEIKASIASVRKLYPGRELTVIFQPHLYTRTRDFADEFAEALSGADRVIMPELYPARELPIEGISTFSILDKVKSKEKQYCERKDLLNLIKNSNFEVLMTLGAADLDKALPEISEVIASRDKCKECSGEGNR